MVSIVLFSAVQGSAVQYSTVHCTALHVLHCSAVPAVQCNALQCRVGSVKLIAANEFQEQKVMKLSPL